MTRVSPLARTAVDGPLGGGSARPRARPDAGKPSWPQAVRFGVVRSSATPYRVLIAVVTAVLGAAVSLAAAYGLPLDERTFIAVAAQTQTAMSITASLIGVLLASDLRRWFTAARAASGSGRVSGRRRGRPSPSPRSAPTPLPAPGEPTDDTASASSVPPAAYPRQYRSTPGPTLAAAALVALAYGALGSFLAALAVGWTAPTGLEVWQLAGPVVLGGVVVQLVAMFVGTGLGLVIPSRLVACAATVVLPLGLWLLLGLSAATRPARDWLTPYESALRMLSGSVGPLGWAQTLVVAAIWCVALNAVGVRRLQRL